MRTVIFSVLIAAIIVLPCFALIWIGRRISKRLAQSNSNSSLLEKQTPIDVASAACLALVLFVGIGIRELAPHTALGSLLNSTVGLALAIPFPFAVYFTVSMSLRWARRFMQGVAVVPNNSFKPKPLRGSA